MSDSPIPNRPIVVVRRAAAALAIVMMLVVGIVGRVRADASTAGASAAAERHDVPTSAEEQRLAAQEQQIVIADHIDVLIRDCMSEQGLAWRTGHLAAVLKNVIGHGQMRTAAGEEDGRAVADEGGRRALPLPSAPPDPNAGVRSGLSEAEQRTWLETALSCQDLAHEAVEGR
jgi:hypothetical protein